MRFGLRAASLSILGAAAAIFFLSSSVPFLYVASDPGPPLSGELAIGNSEALISVTRDPFGVPHVSAETLADAYRGLGFAHAQDRLWQMELLRRTARGRLSELFGSATLEEDRLARILGLAHAAKAERQGLSRRIEKLLVAYSEGVNRWIEEVGERRRWRPVELRWLDAEIEPWTPEDSLAIVRMRAWNLGRSLSATLLLDGLRRDLGGASSRDFFPEDPADGSHDALGALLDVGRTADRYAARTGLNGAVGSLGFIVGAERSASGRPILANDPHTQFSLPATFYLAHIQAGAEKIAGATWPGVPVFWTGTNGKIAWGSVALHASVSDLYDETLHPDDALRYNRAGRWRRAETRTETIGLRGGDSVEIDIVSTHNGPLLRPLADADPQLHGLSLHWTGQARSSGTAALLALQRARDWETFRGEVKKIPAPVATYLYADVEGNAGRQIGGRLPIRAIETGLLPVTGGSRFYAWRGFIPFDDLPSEFGPETPWIVASTHPDLSELEHPVTWLWSSPGGPERLRDRLAGARQLSLDDVVVLQREHRSARGPDAVARLLDGVRPATESAARVMQVLGEWDGDTSADSAGALVYHVFRQRLAMRLLRSRLEPRHVDAVLSASEPAPGVMVERFFDRLHAPEVQRGVAVALEDTWSFLRAEVSANPAKWSWGRLHHIQLRHAFAGRARGAWDPTGWLGRRLSAGPFPAPGDPDSVWTMYHGPLSSGDVGVGPVLRYAVDLGDPDHALAGLAGGQSGAPGSPFYTDGIGEWLGGEPRPLWMHRSDVAYHKSGVWKLVPTAVE